MDKYELLKQVGEGSFGQVFKAKRKCDGATVAYKVTRKKGRSSKELKSLRRECEIQKDMHHPNIIQMLDSFETETKIVVVTEYVDKELYEILGKAGRLSEDRAQVISCDLVSALHYLHSNRIVHRDMKPQNVLLDTNGVAKLCDFGFARLMSLGTHVLMSIKGTPLYMAPELIDELPYDHNVDLWSLGCIVYELVTGVPPFPTSSMRHLVKLIRHDEIKWPDHISAHCKTFLQGLLQKDPSQRLTWPNLLEHSFVKGRILTVDENMPRSLTTPLSASQARAKQQQLQSLASRFTSQSKKILEKQIKKIHSQVLRRSEPSGSESSASVDVLLNNLSLRASLRSDLIAADHVLCQVNCPIIDDEFQVKQQQHEQQFVGVHLESIKPKSDCFVNANTSENPIMVPAACCIVALHHNNANMQAAWPIDNVNGVTAPSCCLTLQNNCKSETCCLPNFNKANSATCFSTSMDNLNSDYKQTFLRQSCEQNKDIVLNANNIMQRRTRIPDWIPNDTEQPIENEEWVVFLQRSMEEMMDGEIESLLQENCMSVFVSPLKNPASSCRVVEYISCLMSLPFVLGCITGEDLERIQRVYLDVRIVPNLVYAVKLLMSMKCYNTKTDASSSAAMNKWRSSHTFSTDELRALENTMLLLCRLVHEKLDFLIQFCDAICVVPDGLQLFQQLLDLEQIKARVVSDLIAMMSQVLRSRTGNIEIVDGILLKNKSADELIDLFTKLVTHKQSKVRLQVCIFLLLLGKSNHKMLQRIWGKSLRSSLESLVEDRDKSVQEVRITIFLIIYFYLSSILIRLHIISLDCFRGHIVIKATTIL
ncbi:PREDICTED: serine/threonine-protein kinase fused [Ceratosolen solmsi marchali]|uniref:non-specific serine/threonine protein kinase n=1 Tax=Ceratosolen solmsi marchali TaxID=326594 RepID=A0AAJ6YS39_9HYME|nr:PREDICTED: serine/threonine-protein kinase fused [Ceratosolen solmsi marchali]